MALFFLHFLYQQFALKTAPTYADAEVQKAGKVTRQQQQAQVNRNIRSTALGVTEDAATKKKTLLGE